MSSLYIHIPWCIRKCPYCDFNSHVKQETMKESLYIEALIADLDADLEWMPRHTLNTIFIGGGTPSLFSAHSYEKLLDAIQSRLPFRPNIEITLEANPGTFELARFRDYRQLGINRLSLGIQSFHSEHLKRLGRIHDGQNAKDAIIAARSAGFKNINLDIMYALPEQTAQEGLNDLKTALSFQPEHLSWYELTLEPNTVFYKKPPPLPSESIREELECQGLEYLKENHFRRYEISAFSKEGYQSRHNLNYWTFGDYYGIGAGAHGKMRLSCGTHTRTQKQRQPDSYLHRDKPFLVSKTTLTPKELIFEFMLNATRLEGELKKLIFTEKTGLSFDEVLPILKKAETLGLVTISDENFTVTSKGRSFTNDLQAMFLDLV